MFFAIGSVGYALLELVWRGRTHWSMMLAGGICFVLFSHIAERFSERGIVAKAILCSVCVTVVELVFGLVFNILLKLDVWDYSRLPFNLFGQVCLYYSLLWCGLGFLFIPVAERLNTSLANDSVL